MPFSAEWHRAPRCHLCSYDRQTSGTIRPWSADRGRCHRFVYDPDGKPDYCPEPTVSSGWLRDYKGRWYVADACAGPRLPARERAATCGGDVPARPVPAPLEAVRAPAYRAHGKYPATPGRGVLSSVERRGTPACPSRNGVRLSGSCPKDRPGGQAPRRVFSHTELGLAVAVCQRTHPRASQGRRYSSMPAPATPPSS